MTDAEWRAGSGSPAIVEKAITFAEWISTCPSWSRRFPGTADQAAAARHWITGLLPPGPELQDLLTIAGELTANAVRHTRSGRPDGTFGVTVAQGPGSVRLTVSDQGAPAPPVMITDSDGAGGGLGLYIVSRLAFQWGVAGGEAGRQVWADLPWTAPR